MKSSTFPLFLHFPFANRLLTPSLQALFLPSTMAGSYGPSFCCHPGRRRLTAITTVSLLATMMILAYNFAYDSGSVLSAEFESHRRREDKLSHTQMVMGGARPLNCSLRVVRKFPSALIIGVRKGGTRALLEMLKCHPDIVTATSEIHYFDRDENFANGVQWYIDRMPLSTKTQITIEKSPSYFVTPQVAKRVFMVSPTTKIILIVRNPLDRIVSDYTQLLRKGRNKKSFEGDVFLSPSGEINTAFYPVSISMYDIHFERWLKHFQLSQILIVNGDALIRDPTKELKKVEEFLEVSEFFQEDMFYFNATKGFYCWKKSSDDRSPSHHCLGSAKGHHLPQLSNDTVQRLRDFFRPHNERFFTQVQQRFSWDKGYSNIGTLSKF